MKNDSPSPVGDAILFVLGMLFIMGAGEGLYRLIEFVWRLI